MKNIFTFLAGLLLTATTYAQIGINIEIPHASAALDITSTTKELLMTSQVCLMPFCLSTSLIRLIVTKIVDKI